MQKGGDQHGKVQQRSDEREGCFGGVAGAPRSEVESGCKVGGGFGAHSASEHQEVGCAKSGPGVFRPCYGIWSISRAHAECDEGNGMDETVVSALEWLQEHRRPIAVFLIGSRARGDHRPNSDYDFLIVIEDDIFWEIDSLNAHVAEPLRRFTRRDCDTVVNSKSGFCEEAQVGPSLELPRGSFAWQAIREGILLSPQVPVDQFLRDLSV